MFTFRLCCMDASHGAQQKSKNKENANYKPTKLMNWNCFGACTVVKASSTLLYNGRPRICRIFNDCTTYRHTQTHNHKTPYESIKLTPKQPGKIGERESETLETTSPKATILGTWTHFSFVWSFLLPFACARIILFHLFYSQLHTTRSAHKTQSVSVITQISQIHSIYAISRRGASKWIQSW